MPAPAPQPESRRSRGRAAWLGLALTVAMAAVLFTRFSIDDRMSRDEAIWTYGGQQLLHGVPYYNAIFDAKTPLAPMLAAVGVKGARIVGGNDVHGARIVFLLLACAAAAGIYELALALWGSVLAALLSAAAFLAFKGFAFDALGGPQAKTPGIAFAVFSMVLLVRRRWLWGGAIGALAFLCWQPLGIYMVAAVVAAAAVSERSRRLRSALWAALGAAVPVAAMFVYFWAAGGLSQYVDAAFRFPLEGVKRDNETVGARIGVIRDVVGLQYNALHGWVFWGGLIALGVAVVVTLWRSRSLRHPLVCVVALSFLALAAFSLQDFQAYPDVFPLLPYAAVGVGAVAVLAGARVRGRPAQAVGAGLVAAIVAFVVLTWHTYANTPRSLVSLHVQEARAATVQELLGPQGRLYAIGDPTALVLTHRRNPNRYIYLGSGVWEWMIKRTHGGIDGLLARIHAFDPGVIVIHTFDPTHGKALAFLGALQVGYTNRWIGSWRVLIKPELLRRVQPGLLPVPLGKAPPQAQ